MHAGFPRPQFQVEKTKTARLGEKEWGSYGEKWDNRSYPIPYTAEDYSISTLNSDRLEDCVSHKKCIACGEAVEEELVTILLYDGQVQGESGPFHEKCARLTNTMCPHINLNPDFLFIQVAWSEVADRIAELAVLS